MDYNIRQLRSGISKEMLKETYRVVSNGKVLGVWYPGDQGLVMCLQNAIESLCEIDNRVAEPVERLEGLVVELKKMSNL